ncbi:MAG: alcohol dehydrogenase catalytic domain-containing protein [Verrucomicrobiota bacterium]
MTVPAPPSPIALPATMKAVTHPQYGAPGLLQVSQVPLPRVGDEDVLIRVVAAAINKGDWHMVTGKPYLIRLAGYGLRKPKHLIIGQEVAGIVEAVGSRVARFQVGDEVFGETKSGAFGEFVCVGEGEIAPKLAPISFEEAAYA